MRPKYKGWINNYADFFQGLVRELKYGEQLKSSLNGNSFDENFYQLIQPTGLMYGHAIQPAGSYNLKMKYWDEREKLKFILFDSFVHHSILIHEDNYSNNIRDLIHYSVNEMIDFYQHSYPNISFRKNDYFGRRKNEIFMAESLLHNRIQIRSGLNDNFWAGFFNNSLLFLDVYFYGIWLQRKDAILAFDDLGQKLEEVRLCILKIISSASHADHSLDYEERKLFKFFLQSAGLSSDAEAEALTYLKDGIDIRDIEFPDIDSWLLKKYLFELATLTIWSDRHVNEKEKEYLAKLGEKLKFSETEIESSLLAIESFVITHWEQVHFLQSRHNFHILRDRFATRLGKILVKNKNAFEKELLESKELLQLLKKATRQELNEEEKTKVRTQLIDVLKTIPTFVIIALPFTFITLPLLIKILPKSAFPTAFSEEED